MYLLAVFVIITNATLEENKREQLETVSKG